MQEYFLKETKNEKKQNRYLKKERNLKQKIIEKNEKLFAWTHMAHINHQHTHTMLAYTVSFMLKITFS